jgi:hypothetical protein
VVTVELTFVIVEARDELEFCIFEDIVSTLAANDELALTIVVLVVVMDDAKDELFVLILLCNPSILVAADELFVDIVFDNVVTEEFSDDDALVYEALRVNNCVDNDELVVTAAVLISVIADANEALSIEPVPSATATIVSILPDNEAASFANVVFTTLILAAKEALFVFTVLTMFSILCAAEELFVVTVPCMVVILDAREELFVLTEL